MENFIKTHNHTKNKSTNIHQNTLSDEFAKNIPKELWDNILLNQMAIRQVQIFDKN